MGSAPRPGPGGKPLPRRPGTTRLPREAASPPKKNNLPLVLGGAGGGLLLLIILVVVLSSGGSRPAPEETARPVAAKRPDAPKPPPVDVSALEALGKQKCQAGLDKIRPRLNPSPDAPQDRVRADLEEGLHLLKAGLAAYDEAARKAGKSYDLAEIRKTQQRAFKIFCDGIEAEGQAACDQGLKLIQSTEAMMVDGARLSDADKARLKADLQKGVDLIRDGMNLFDRSQQVSGNTFDTTRYTKARKAAAMKIGELK